jgi:asparagine synthase (glutamine-hydrolysing)
MLENPSTQALLSGIKGRRGPSSWIASLCNPHQTPGLMGGMAGGESARAIEVVPRQGGSDRTLYLGVEPGYSFPDVAHGNGCGLIFEGDLYNRSELEDKLEESLFKPWSDAELLLKAYQRWGKSFIKMIKGIYVIILWDGQEQNLLCVRDRAGVYPFFYAMNDHHYLFSTSCAALARHPCVSKEINKRLILEQFCQQWSYSEDTFYRSVHRLFPAHMMDVSSSGRRIHRYWDPLGSGSQIRWVREEELEQFDALFEQAVSRCHPQGRTGIFLSGGLDSVSVAAVSSDISCRENRPVPLALSLGIPDTWSEEAMIQKAVARELDLPQAMLSLDEAVGSEGWLEAGLALNRRWPWPLYNCWIPLLHCLAQEGKRQGCDGILTGFAGDEWLTASPYLSADLFRSMDLKGFYHLWRGLFRSYNIPYRRALRIMMWKHTLNPLFMPWARKRLEEFSPSLLKAVRRFRMNRSFPDWVIASSEMRRQMMHRRDADREPANAQSQYLRRLRATFRNFVSMTALEESFEFGRRVDLRILHPFWDADLVEFLCRVPPRLLHKGDRSKALIRKMLKKRFPSLGLDRQKKIEQDDLLVTLMRERGPRVWKNLGGAKKLADLGLVDSKRLERKVRSDVFNNKDKDVYWFWMLINLESWLRIHA